MKKFIVITMLALIMAPVASAHESRIDKLPTKVLAKEAKKVVRHGGVYSHKCGDASPYLKRLSYELVERAFRPYGTQDWALYIVGRESCFNPGAINTKYSNPKQQATGLAQLIPAIHTWVNYDRMVKDPWYGAMVFVKLSNGGKSTGPWACSC